MTLGEIGFAFAGLVVGAAVGVWGTLKSHNLAIIRDQRKEWNEAAQPIRKLLITKGGKTNPFTPMPSTAELQLIADMMSRQQRNEFWTAWEKYNDAHENAQMQDELGGVFYSKEGIKEITKRIETLLNCIPRL